METVALERLPYDPDDDVMRETGVRGGVRRWGERGGEGRGETLAGAGGKVVLELVTMGRGLGGEGAGAGCVSSMDCRMAAMSIMSSSCCRVVSRNPPSPFSIMP